MRTRMRILGSVTVLAAAGIAVPLLSTSSAQAARFTGGDVVVYRVGAGTAALDNSATAVFLDDYSPTGTLVQSIPVQTAAGAAGFPLTATGLSRSEGLLTRSPDGRFVTFTGYDVAPGATGPGTKSLTSTLTSDVSRSIGVLDANGTVDTSTTLSPGDDFDLAPSIVRSAATKDGETLYAAGGNNGVLATTLGANTTATTTAVAGSATSNLNQLSYAGGKLYVSGNDTVTVGGTPTLVDRIASVTPGTNGNAGSLTTVGGLPTNLLTYGYAFLDLTGANFDGTGLDTLYIANSSERGGTIDKYTYNGVAWTRQGFLDVPGATALVADSQGGTVSLAVTTPTSLLTVADSTGASDTFTPGTVTTLASAATNTEFRGVALAPTGTAGPSVFIRTPTHGRSVSITGATIPVTAYVASPGTVTSVAVKIGTSTVATATKAADGLYHATVSTKGLKAGVATLTVAATGTGGTTTSTRPIVLAGSPPVVLVGLRAGKYGWDNKLVTKKGFATYATTKSPTKKGLKSATKGSTATVKIVGKSVVITFDKSPKSGKATVTIDGKASTVDLYFATNGSLIKTYTLTGGTTKSHTVVVTVLGTKAVKSKGKTVSLAALQVK